MREEIPKLPPLDGERLVIPIFLGAKDVDVGVNPSFGGGAGAADGFADFLSQGGGRRRRPVTVAVKARGREGRGR